MQTVEGHSALLQGLGELGDVTPGLMPGLLRLSHIRYASSGALVTRELPPCCHTLTLVWLFRAKVQGGDSTEALKENARGILIWQVRTARLALRILDLYCCRL